MLYPFYTTISLDGSPTILFYLGNNDVDTAIPVLKTKLAADGYTVGACYSCARHGGGTKAVSTAALAATNSLTSTRSYYEVLMAYSDGSGGETQVFYNACALSVEDAVGALTLVLSAEGKTGLRGMFATEVFQIHYV